MINCIPLQNLSKESRKCVLMPGLPLKRGHAKMMFMHEVVRAERDSEEGERSWLPGIQRLSLKADSSHCPLKAWSESTGNYRYILSLAPSPFEKIWKLQILNVSVLGLRYLLPQ